MTNLIPTDKNKITNLGTVALRTVGDYLPGKQKARFFLWTNKFLRDFGENTDNTYGFISFWTLKDLEFLGYEGDKYTFLKDFDECSTEKKRELILKYILSIRKPPPQTYTFRVLDLYSIPYIKRIKEIVSSTKNNRQETLTRIAEYSDNIPFGEALIIIKEIKNKEDKNRILGDIIRRSNMTFETLLEVIEMISNNEEKIVILINILKRKDIPIDKAIEVAEKLPDRGNTLFYDKNTAFVNIAKREDISLNQSMNIAQRITYNIKKEEAFQSILQRNDISATETLTIMKTVFLTPHSERMIIEKVVAKLDISINKAIEIAEEYGNINCFEHIASRPDISPDMAFEVLYKIPERSPSRSHALKKIIGRKDVPLYQALEKIQNLHFKDDFIEIISCREDISIQRAYEIAKTISRKDEREKILRKIAYRTDISLDEVYEAIANITDTDFKQMLFAGIASRKDVPIAMSFKIADKIPDILYNTDRDYAYSKIARRTDISIEGAFEYANKITDEYLRNQILKDIEKKVNANLLEKARAIFNNISN
jgi:hypothetical protein